MSDFRKARVILSAVYRNGEVLKQDDPRPARVDVLPIHGAEGFRELNLRIVVDSRSSEELLEGLVHGNVTLSVEQMLSPVERETIKA